MATNSIGSFMKSVFPSLVNKEGEVFSSLLTDGKGGGTLEAMWEAIEAERKEWVGDGSVYSQTGEELYKTLSLMSVLSRAIGDTEENYKNKIALLFIRGENAIWGSQYDVQRIFRELLNNNRTWIVSNCESGEESLLDDGSFERESAWSLSGDCSYEKEARLIEGTGVLFSGSGECKQTVSIKEKTPYFFHFFMKGGPLEVLITNEEGKYWTPSKDGFGTWEEEECFKSFEWDKEDDSWDNKSLMFMTGVEAKEVTITLRHKEGEKETCLDYARLFEKTAASTFALITVFEYRWSTETANLAPGSEDEDDEGKRVHPEWDYETLSYFSNSYIFGSEGFEGAAGVYKKFLDIISPAGVSCIVETLARDEDVEENESKQDAKNNNNDEVTDENTSEDESAGDKENKDIDENENNTDESTGEEENENIDTDESDENEEENENTNESETDEEEDIDENTSDESTGEDEISDEEESESTNESENTIVDSENKNTIEEEEEDE